MSFLNGLSRIARAHARRRTEVMLNALPLEIQKDIGWRWSSNRRESEVSRLSAWNL